jgi:PAS domain S-box-containing protein
LNEAVLLAIGTVAGTVLAALGKFFIDLRKSKGEADLAERGQISKEYKVLIEQGQQQLAAERADRAAQVKKLEDALDVLRERVTALHVEREQIKGDLRVATAQVNALRVSQISSQASTWLDTLVIADDDGKIVEWNKAAEVLFHYTRDEIVGRDVACLIPASLRPKYADSLARVRADKIPPRDRPFFFNGVTKEGAEVPVEITLSGWQSGDRWFYGAAVRRRYEPAPPQEPPK